MNFIKKHWIALAVIAILLFVGYTIFTLGLGIGSGISSALSSLNPLNWFSSNSSSTSAANLNSTALASAVSGSNVDSDLNFAGTTLF